MPNFAAASLVKQNGGNWAAVSLIDDNAGSSLIADQEFNGEEVVDGIYYAVLQGEGWNPADYPTIAVDFDGTEYVVDFNDSDYSYGASNPGVISESEYPFCIMFEEADVTIYVTDRSTHEIAIYPASGGGGTEFISVLLSRTAFVTSEDSVFALVYSDIDGEYVYTPIDIADSPEQGSNRFYVPFINGIGTIVIIDDNNREYVYDCHDSTDVTSAYNCPAGVHIFTVQQEDGFVEVSVSR